MIDARCRLSALSFFPNENPDWDFARTRRLALRTPHGEWCQSALSACEADGFWYHQVDYAHEGFVARVQGESWKAIDRIGFRLVVEGQTPELRAGEVTVTPDWVLYRFEAEEGCLGVRYQLFEVPEAATAMLAATYTWEGAGKADILLKPLLDLRDIHYFSDPEGHHAERLDERLLVVHHQRHLAIASDTPFALFPDRQVRELYYPLGSGEREVLHGRIHFKREYFRGMSLGAFAFDLSAPVTLAFVAAPHEAEAIGAVHVGLEHLPALEAACEASAASYHARLPGLAREVASRVYVMAEKFDLPRGERAVPGAGAWWAREPHLSSIFEGLLHNRQTLLHVGRGALIEESIRLALDHPAPETDLLLFDFLAEHLPALRDPNLLDELYEAYRRAFEAFASGSHDALGGAPVLDQRGLLSSQPSASWMNGMRALSVEGLQVGGLPVRIDPAWQQEAIAWLRDARHVQALFQVPAYYLPELNARWIRMLETGMALADRCNDAALLDASRVAYERALSSFKRVFWNPEAGFLYNLVTREGRVDPTRAITAVEAAARLGERVFSRDELAAIWEAARDHLLVRRTLAGRPAAFGLIAKESAERTYLGDVQAYEAVCWPSKTPYLLKLLAQLGETRVMREILATNLAHQFDEGAVFYAGELMSLPEGGNPSPNPATAQDPVPVRNPMHWAALWCDAYLAAATDCMPPRSGGIA
ncbi:hypothetical protein J7643_07490 [bacterium]|nr:hypothetical protein [bacterium]